MLAQGTEKCYSERNMYMEIRNSKTEMPLFKVKGEKFIFAVQINCKVNAGL